MKRFQYRAKEIFRTNNIVTGQNKKVTGQKNYICNVSMQKKDFYICKTRDEREKNLKL